MTRKRLGIYDSDVMYARRLGAYIRQRSEGNLEVKIFTERRLLEDCIGRAELDCVLACREAKEACLQHEDIWFALLSEDGKEDGTAPVIDKYQPAEKIWRTLTEAGGLTVRAVAAGTGEPVLLGVCSPFHGCGKTAAALFMSRALAEEERTLFVTLDEFSSLPEAAGEGRPDGELSELYYYYSQDQLTGERIREAVWRWNEAECAAPVRAVEDLYRAGKPYEAEFFRALAEAGGYRYVMIDMGSSLYGRDDLIEACENIFVQTGDGERFGIFEEWLKERGFTAKAIRYDLWAAFAEEGMTERAFSGRTGERIRQLLSDAGYLRGRDD